MVIMNKKKYIDAEMEIIQFDAEDIITASGEDGGDDGDGDDF